MSLEHVNLKPVATVRSPQSEPVDEGWANVTSTIEFDREQFGPECLEGLASFSHLEVVFVFHKVDDSAIERGTRHPRGEASLPAVGIFAQRGKDRPNRLGVSVCRLVSVDGLNVRVEGLDAIDGSPVLDIKPYMTEYGPKGAVEQPRWSHEIMVGYYQI